ncbi:hypothetical protein [Bacillus sp. Hm123]|uniref:hypothetical protein n=1 Tax=Bacillus sp. Hm123 TaxID=3450745 RepID=UPI003F438ED4
MKYFEFADPYYALIKAKHGEEAVKKYIEVVAGVEDDFESLLEECNLVPKYYAVAKFARSKGEDGELITLDETLETLESDETEILLMDGSLL